MMGRRLFVASIASFASTASMASMAGCGKGPPRCKRCGMTLDAASRWYATLDTGSGVLGFDTPKCAVTIWRRDHASVPADKLTFVGYYGQKQAPATSFVLAVGSDVLGPMGEDLVPVEPEHGARFRADHKARELLSIADVSLERASGI